MMSENNEASSTPLPSPSTTITDMNCSICLQSFTYPVELPCKHIFCFLCIKGFAFANQTPAKRCALCRSEIDDDYFNKPKLLELNDIIDDCDNDDDTTAAGAGVDWYYKSNTNDLWWKYDKNSRNDIENAYQFYLIDNTKSQFKLLIAGNVYIIDFKLNLQIRNDNRLLRRKIKRDKLNKNHTIGIAGLKINKKDNESDNLDDLTKNFDSLKLNQK